MYLLHFSDTQNTHDRNVNVGINYIQISVISNTITIRNKQWITATNIYKCIIYNIYFIFLCF